MVHASKEPATQMCVPRPLPTALGLFLLLRLLWRPAWASGTPPAKGFWCQLLMWLVVPRIPVATGPSPVQMLHVSAEIRAVGVGPPPHTRWLALLRLFSVLTYLLLNFWESCEFGKEKKKKTSPTTNRKKKKNQEVSFSQVTSKHREYIQEASWTFSERREIKK